MNIHTTLHSPRRRSFTAKAIFGLLLAVVMVGAFATAGSADNIGNPRWGWLHVTKECSHFSDGYCTITGSNLNAIQPGMKVIYASAPDFTTMTLNSDLVLDGPGQNDAYGHVKLSLQTFTGPLTFSGGTGQFRGFHAIVWVDCRPAGSPCTWDGLYGFTPPGHDK